MTAKDSNPVISQLNLPTPLPISFTIAVALLLDRAHAPGWLWGMFFTIMAIVWIIAILASWSERYVKITPWLKTLETMTATVKTEAAAKVKGTT
jgi:hypothetical protein